MTDDATLSTPPAPDAVKRYCINRVRGEDCLVGIYEPPNGPEQFVTAEVEFVLASDYDSMARQRDALKARVEAMQSVVNAASVLEQAVDSEDQDSEDHYDAQMALCESIQLYRKALAGDQP